jgi:hypothetical protein
MARVKLRVRLAVAFVAARLANGSTVDSIFDCAVGRRLRFGGTVRPDFVNVFDGELGAHLTGTGESGRFKLVHYGESHRITLEIDGTHFEGFDHGTSSRFTGDVRGGVVTLFDHGEGQSFEYSV